MKYSEYLKYEKREKNQREIMLDASCFIKAQPSLNYQLILKFHYDYYKLKNNPKKITKAGNI